MTDLTACPAPSSSLVYHIHRNEGPQTYQDSITIGSPSKGGEMKIYGSLDDPAGFERRIKEAYRLRKIAQDATEMR
jgi:hypothetical protein